MTLESLIPFAIQAAVGLFTVGGAYATIKYGIKDSHREAGEAKKIAKKAAEDQERDNRAVLRRLDEFEAALRKRLEDQDRGAAALDRRVVAVEITQGHHAQQLAAGFAQVNASIAAMSLSVSNDIRAVHARVDLALQERP